MNIDVVQALRQTDFFGDLDESLLARLAQAAVQKRLKRDETLFVAGEPANGLYVIASGSVRAFRASADGREQVIHTERAGATVGELPLFDGQPYPSTVAAEENSIVLFIDRATVLQLCQAHPEIAMAAVRALCRRLRRCAGLVETLSLRAVGQRLAHWVLNEARSRGQQRGLMMEVEIALSKEQIATRIGSVREVVSRALARLEEDGLLKVSGHQVTIPNVDRLSRYIEQV